MLRVRKSQANKIHLTLQEKKTVNIYYPLFRFVPDKRQSTEFLVHLDADLSTVRYDEFTLTLPSDVNLPTGDYHYYVYQSETPIDQDYSNMVLLEQGKMTVNE